LDEQVLVGRHEAETEQGVDPDRIPEASPPLTSSPRPLIGPAHRVRRTICRSASR
jgi:hypothetical protein